MRTSVLLLLWHTNDAIAGGFVRVQEFMHYFGDIDVTIIDNSPNLIDKRAFKNVKIISYTTPNVINKFYSISYSLGRIVEWLYTMLILIYLGKKELLKKNYQVIYGPTGDNLHIFLAGVVLKMIFPQKKLLLDVLNLEMPEGNSANYYRTFREKKVGIIEAFLKTYSLTFLLFTEKLLIKKCDYIVTVSPYMKKVISNFFHQEKIDFTPSGVRVPKKMKKFEKSEKLFDGIYVGRHTKDKGIFDLIQVWNNVLKKNPNAKFITAGSCPKETKDQLEGQVEALKSKENITIRGMVSEEEKWRLLGESKIFIHLAYFEPLVPVITVLEALAFGMPVIMYDVKAIEDYPFLRKNRAILIVKNKNIDDVTKKVIEFMKLSKKERQEIKIIAKSLARKFTWENAANKELRIIKKLAILKSE